MTSEQMQNRILELVDEIKQSLDEISELARQVVEAAGGSDDAD